MAVLRREGPAEEPGRVQVGHGAQHLFRIQPVDIKPVSLLDGEKVLEDLDLVVGVGHERIPALPPFDIVPEVLFPMGDHFNAAQTYPYLGRVGEGGPQTADGLFVGTLARAGPLVDDQRA